MDLNRAEKLALHHISLHCPEYSFEFDESARCLGRCWWFKKVITLSRPFTLRLPEDTVVDTILHECAHALAYLKGDLGHGRVWQEEARKLGATPKASTRTGLKSHDIKEPLYKLMFGDEVIHGYYSKPSAATYASLPYVWARGRKEETYGKLVIVGKESQLQKLYDQGITFTGMSKKCPHCNKKDTAWVITPGYNWQHKCGGEVNE